MLLVELRRRPRHQLLSRRGDLLDRALAGLLVTFPGGEATRTVSLAIVNDSLAEGGETVNLALSSPAGGATLGPQATAVLTITDNDVAGTLQFTATSHEVTEGTASAVLTVARSAGAASGVSR